MSVRGLAGGAVKRVWRHSSVAWMLIAAIVMQPVGLPSSAAAATSRESTAAAELERKRVEQTQIAGELEATRAQLATEVSEYVEITKQIKHLRTEVSEVTTELAAMNADLLVAEQAVVDRAIEIYRSDSTGLLQLLLNAGSIADLMDRLNYLVAISRRDSRLITDLRMARAENEWLQEKLTERVAKLEQLQQDADARRMHIEDELEKQQARAAAIGEDIAQLMRSTIIFAGSMPNSEFNPDTVISDASYRSSTSMTVADVQAFLEQQSGTLATYKARDHLGRVKTTAEMVVEAGQAWNVSPKVILVTLQKEQSLLSDRSVKQRQYDWAMGCGKADSRTYYQYQGFGRQIWFGAQKLSENARPWKPGIQMKIDGSIVSPTNSSTYSLYKYTPHFKGTMSFWLLYWRYFGDPLI